MSILKLINSITQHWQPRNDCKRPKYIHLFFYLLMLQHVLALTDGQQLRPKHVGALINI